MIIESIRTMNDRLRNYWGLAENGDPLWRVSFCGNQTEKIITDFVAGIQLTTPRVEEVLKYPFNQDNYVLERLVPVGSNPDLLASWSYEPVWHFVDKDGNPLPPKWEAIEFIVQRINDQITNRNGHPKYQMTEKDRQDPESIAYRVSKLHAELYGDASRIGDSLQVKEGVGFTTSKILKDEE